MKRILQNIILVLATVLATGACAISEIEVQPPVTNSGQGIVTLNLKNAAAAKTKADDTPPPVEKADPTYNETAVQHLDIFLFHDGGSYSQDKSSYTKGQPAKMKLHLRRSGTEIEGNKTVIGRKEDFDVEQESDDTGYYWVYVVANSQFAAESFDALVGQDFAEFAKLIQPDPEIYITAHSGNPIPGTTVPSHFLMDGVAYLTNVNEPIKFSDGSTDDMNLTVKLKRAAAKIVVHLKEKEKSTGTAQPNDAYTEFNTTAPVENPDVEGEMMSNPSGFFFRNLPYTTYMIAPDANWTAAVPESGREDVQLRNTSRYGNQERFKTEKDMNGNETGVTITTYAYSYSWAGEGNLNGLSLVVNIPMKSYQFVSENINGVAYEEGNTGYDGTTAVQFTKDANGNALTNQWFVWEEEILSNNYYQIPVSQSKELERNGFYEVTATISIPGGEDAENAIPIENAQYKVYEWTPKTINVGGDESSPDYLAVNENKFRMYNVAVDTTLEFASSRAVDVEVVNFYFINKFGKRIYRYKVDDSYNTIYPKEEDEENAAEFGGEPSGSHNEQRSKTITIPANTTYYNAVSLVVTQTGLSRSEAEEFVQQYVTFDGTYDASYTTWEDTEQTTRYPESGTFSRQTRNNLINALIREYPYLSQTEAGNLIDQATNDTDDDFYYQRESGWFGSSTTYYYGFVPNIPVKNEVTHEETVTLKGDYNTVRNELSNSKYGLNNTQITGILEGIVVTGTVTAEWTERVYEYENLVEVKAKWNEELNGKIEIDSPVPTNNTIRYIELKVTHEDGSTNMSETVTIEQYPLEYITNIQSWYSYRSDFGGTTYQHKGTNRYISAVSYNDNSGTWTYSTTYSNNQQTKFYRAKYAVEGSNGQSTLYFYTWGEYDNNVSQGTSSTGLNNARMYHVIITTSSNEYKLGVPRITGGITDSGADNALMVSPSFMIASQLGAVATGGLEDNDVALAASHCKAYVEVYKDPKTNEVIHLHDWRLPTAAELKIIDKFQRMDGSAIDVVLSGGEYFSASGPVEMQQGSGLALRCIRDAYELPSQTQIPVVD